MVTDGKPSLLSPEGLAETCDALERVVRRDQCVMLSEEIVRRWHDRIMYHRAVDAKDEQRRRLRETTVWAEAIRRELQELLDAQGKPVHFRPSSTGVAMIGLQHDLPQRGKSGLKDLKTVAIEFEALYAKHCGDIEQGRETGEKALQSFLIRESYKNGRRLAPINAASTSTNEPVELVFVTDEISLPVGEGKIVCDVLALRRDGGRSTPVLLELKDARMQKRLVEQVEGYAALIDEHPDEFAALFSALLGETVRFDGPTEKWIVWPVPEGRGLEKDPREDELRARNIRVVSYAEAAGAYTFRVGDR